MDLFTVKTWEQQKAEVIAAVGRGCDSADLTGGEPLQNPNVAKLVKFATENKIYTRIITSLICPEKTLDDVLDAGADDWLISMHGAKEETHNEIVAVPRARTFQIRRLEKIAKRMRYCANYVMVERNQTEMLDWANWLLSLDHEPPKAVNFINFNVFDSWTENGPQIRQKALDNIVDLRVAGPILDEAIDVLEAAGIGVNVRYYPYCGLSERHYKNVCNDLHVAFDPFEWDNAFGARATPEKVYRDYSVPLSNRNEEKGKPCSGCGHQWICGGANRLWHKFALEKFKTELLVPLPITEGVDPKDFWHYRKENKLSLAPRKQKEIEGGSV